MVGESKAEERLQELIVQLTKVLHQMRREMKEYEDRADYLMSKSEGEDDLYLSALDYQWVASILKRYIKQIEKVVRNVGE